MRLLTALLLLLLLLLGLLLLRCRRRRGLAARLNDRLEHWDVGACPVVRSGPGSGEGGRERLVSLNCPWQLPSKRGMQAGLLWLQLSMPCKLSLTAKRHTRAPQLGRA